MLGRILLILLAIVLAAPVAASACHAPAKGEQHAGTSHHQSAPDDDDDAAATACVGCVPPSSWIAPRVAEPVAFAAPAPSASVAALSLGRGAPPALPPPRIG